MRFSTKIASRRFLRKNVKEDIADASTTPESPSRINLFANFVKDTVINNKWRVGFVIGSTVLTVSTLFYNKVQSDAVKLYGLSSLSTTKGSQGFIMVNDINQKIRRHQFNVNLETEGKDNAFEILKSAIRRTTIRRPIGLTKLQRDNLALLKLEYVKTKRASSSKNDEVFKSKLDKILTPLQTQVLLSQGYLDARKSFQDLWEYVEHNLPMIHTRDKHIFVIKFKGDSEASQVNHLREEVTAVLSASDFREGDTVLLQLDSGGGTVQGYGLAASQLVRLTSAGLKLIVCVDNVAASGGYMMACVGSEIVASPFAAMGSVGVVMSMQNFSRRLEREGVDFDEITSGKWKSTLAPFKTSTESSKNKCQEQVDEIHKIFKEFVQSHRPHLNVDEIATGEVWFGKDALARNLCDRLGTSDDVIWQYHQAGYRIFSVEYSTDNHKPQSLLDSFFDIVYKSVMASKLASEFGLGALGQSSSSSSSSFPPSPPVWT